MFRFRSFIIWIAVISIASLLVSCSGKYGSRHAKNARRYIDEHNLKNLPRSDIPLEVNERVVAWMQYFQGPGRRHFERYLRRSGRYMPLMSKILKEQGMPHDLIYIALIESGFNDVARSHAGAVGTWQFIRSTGKIYDLRIDGWVDERRDPYKATYAAAKFFADLHDEFDDWYLAMAGYNAGPGRVRKAIKMTRSKDFWRHANHKRALRAETRDYVPKFIAAAIMAKAPERFGFKNIEYEDPIEFETEVVETQTDITVIAKCAGVSEEDVAFLNSHLYRGATPPGVKNYRIKLPKGTVKKFKLAYAKLPEDERIKIVRYKVKRGDSLYRVARRYGVSTGQLASANGISRRARLRRGQTIVIPVGAYAAKFALAGSRGGSGGSNLIRYKVRRGDTLGTIAAKYRGVTVAKLRRWNGLGKRSMIRTGRRLKIYTKGKPSRGKSSGGGKVAYHRVKRGETLGGIAARHGTTAKRLMAWNGIKSPKTLKAGQRLRVSKKVSKPKDTTAIALGDIQTREATGTHTLKSGETLYAVATKYGMTTKELMAINRIKNPRRVRAGTKLKVYGKLPTPSKSQATGRTTAINLEDATRSKAAASSTTHTLKSGETLGHVAERYGVSSRDIMAWNRIKNPRRVRAGTKLKIKGGKVSSKSATSRPAKVAVKPKTTLAATGTTHTLKSGETLGHVAEKYGVTSKQIMVWNGIKNPRRVRAGTKLKIKGGRASPQSVAPSPAKVAAKPNAAPAATSTTHTLKSGETLGHVAERYGVSTKQLMAWNGIKNPRRVRAGTKLRIKGGSKPKSSTSKKLQSAKESSGTPIKLASATVAPKAGGTINHKVRSGETLWDIARKHSVTIAQLQKWNDLKDPSSVRAGTTLKVMKN